MAVTRPLSHPRLPAQPSSPEASARLCSRRGLLRSGLVSVGLAARPASALPLLVPRVAVVGAGLAGLTAAYRLRASGLPVTLFDAADSPGGRVRTVHDLVARGVTTEMGGEFIDSSHTAVLALADEFARGLIDLQAAPGPDEPSYRFQGGAFTADDLARDFAPIFAQVRADRMRMGAQVSFRRHSPRAAALDRTSLADYLAGLEGEDWVKDLLAVACTGEFGLDPDEQSALNLVLHLAGGGLGRPLFRGRDRRYRVRGGSDRLISAMAERIPDIFRPRHRLMAVETSGSASRLVFERGERPVAMVADFVVLALPFSLLRDVEFRPLLPRWKRRGIAQLGYGTGAKLVAGFTRPLWREQGFSGDALSELPFRQCWDHSRGQGSIEGGLTLYAAGTPGLQLGGGSPEEQLQRLLPGVESHFPGLSNLRTGSGARVQWPTEPLARGSHACYRPGQYTSLAGAEALAVGNLIFAGEHATGENRGSMNGAVASGERAARQILGQV